MSAMLRLLAWILALALVALPVVAVVNGWAGGAQFPLRTLRVQGELQRVDEAQLRATVLPFAKRGFFAVQPDRIQAAVSELPWVERAEVRKHWPDVLEVRIDEHRPFARWGSERLLSEPPADQYHTGDDVSPLVAGARLQLHIMGVVQVPKVVGLEQRAAAALGHVDRVAGRDAGEGLQVDGVE